MTFSVTLSILSLSVSSLLFLCLSLFQGFVLFFFLLPGFTPIAVLAAPEMTRVKR